MSTPSIPVFSGYSLWLPPADYLVEMDFGKCIEVFHVGYHRGPFFLPHVALQSYLNKTTPATEEVIMGWMRRLVAGVQPFTFELESSPTFRADNFFQALVLPAKPSPALTALNQTARRLFEGEQDSPFWPHLSLAYGFLEPEMRARMFDHIHRCSLPTSMLVNSIGLYAIPSNDPDCWTLVKKFPFAS